MALGLSPEKLSGLWLHSWLSHEIISGCQLVLWYAAFWSYLRILSIFYVNVVVDLLVIMDTDVRINQAILLMIVVSCVAASERIVHLRTPKETTVGKIMDSCIKMLGMTEDRSLFILKETQGAQNMMYHVVFITIRKTYIYIFVNLPYMCFDLKSQQRSFPQISRLGVCWHWRRRTDNWSCICAKQ